MYSSRCHRLTKLYTSSSFPPTTHREIYNKIIGGFIKNLRTHSSTESPDSIWLHPLTILASPSLKKELFSVIKCWTHVLIYNCFFFFTLPTTSVYKCSKILWNVIESNFQWFSILFLPPFAPSKYTIYYSRSNGQSARHLEKVKRYNTIQL